MPGEFLKKVIRRSNTLSREEYFSFLQSIAENKVSPAAVVAFITALSAREAMLRDVLWFTQFIHAAVPRIKIRRSGEAVNIVGTGGGLQTFNISTTAAFVASAAGATVIKSGSSGYNSACGSLEVLKALGLKSRISIDTFELMVDDLGLGFVNPEWYSPLLKRIAILIQPLSLRDIGSFINTIGPLLCPVEVRWNLIGVSSRYLLDVMGSAVKELNMKNTILCWAKIGIDELSSVGGNALKIMGDDLKEMELANEDFAFMHFDQRKLHGGSPALNAEIMRGILRGTVKGEGRETVALNSAGMLYLAGRVNSIREGFERSLSILDTGKAYAQLENAVAFTQMHA